jgi:hypothetical protein
MAKRKANKMTTVRLTYPSIDEIRVAQGYYTKQEVCRMLGIEYGTLRYHITKEHCPAPSVVITPDTRNRERRRRYYTAADLATLRTYFEAREPWQRPTK